MATLEKKEYNELQAVFGRMLPEFSVFEFPGTTVRTNPAVARPV